MRIEQFVGFGDQLFVKPLLTDTRLVARNQKDARSIRMKANAIRITLSAVSARSSFMLACFDPFSVSACGLANLGPSSFSTST